MGSTVRARKTDRPGKVSRANVQASGTPRMRPMVVAENDASSERRRAASTSGEPNCSQAEVHGVRNSRPTSGRIKNATPAPARNTMRSGAEGRALG